MARSKARAVRLGRAPISLERDGRGDLRVRSGLPLLPYPSRITDRLVRFAAEAPERTFVAKRDPAGTWRRLSYAEALLRARAVGGALLARELSADRPLVILSENDVEHATLALAALHVGVPFLPLSPAYSLSSDGHARLSAVLELVTPGLVFASDGERYERAILDAVPSDVELAVTDRAPRGRSATRFGQLLEGDVRAGDRAHEAVEASSLAKLLLTSGSTGAPKAVTFTQAALSSNQQMLLQALPFLGDAPPVLVDWLPWHHSFGGNHNFGIALYNGGTLYVDDGKPTPALMAETLRNLAEISPSVYFNVPRGFDELARALERDVELARRFFSRVELLFYAGASLSRSTWDELADVATRTVGERIVMITGLGMTETGPFAMCGNCDTQGPGSVGHPAAGTELRLSPAGEKLEVRYRGPNVTGGFFRRPDLTRAAFDEEGFLKSGDAIRFADPERPEDGFLFDGRIAEDFKLDSGAWVDAGPLRARAIEAGAPHVRDAIVTGHDRADVGLLLVVDWDALRALSPEITETDEPNAVLARPAVRTRFQNLIDVLSVREEGRSARVTRALVLMEPLSIDRGEVTDKGSVNQSGVLRSRAELVDRLYRASGSAPDDRVIFARRR